MIKTTINLTEDTKERLSNYGRITSTWDSVLNEILDHIERCDRFWSEQ